MNKLWKKVVADDLEGWNKDTNAFRRIDYSRDGQYAPDMVEEFVAISRTENTQKLGRRFVKLPRVLQLFIEFVALTTLGFIEGTEYVKDLRRQAVL